MNKNYKNILQAVHMKQRYLDSSIFAFYLITPTPTPPPQKKRKRKRETGHGLSLK